MRRSILLYGFFFLFNLLSVNAQNINWAKQGGGTDEDMVNKMVFDKEGNSYIVGYNDSEITFGDITLPAGGFLIKYNPTGEVIWSKTFKGDGLRFVNFDPNGSVVDITIDDNNNIYLIGKFAGQLTLGEKRVNSSSFWGDTYIAKLNEQGDAVWLTSIRGIGDNAFGLCDKIAVDDFENVYIIGRVSNNAAFGDTTFTGLSPNSEPGSGVAFFARFNANGSFDYFRRFPSPSSSSCRDIKTDRNGDVYILGHFRAQLDLSEYGLGMTPETGSGIFLTKFNSKGQLKWIKTSDPVKDVSQDLNLGGLELDRLNNCYVHGSYLNKLAFDDSQISFIPNGFNHKAFIAKFNAKTGSNIWLRNTGAYSKDFKTFAVDSIGNFIIAGVAQESELGGYALNFGKNQFVVAKYDLFGKTLWVQGVHIDLEAKVQTVALSKEGKIGVSGIFRGSYQMPDIKQNGSSILHTYSGGQFASYDILTVVLNGDAKIIKPSHIIGNVFEDINLNCVQDSLEKGIKDMVIKAEPGPFFGITDSLGNYAIDVDTGSYLVSQVIHKQKGEIFIQGCPANNEGVQVTLKEPGQKVTNINFGNQITNCSQLAVDIAADRRRRCFRSKTTVTYTNEGTADARNVRIKVLYPRYVVPIKSSLAWTARQDSVLLFDIGTLKAGERRSFVITDSTICGNEGIRGLSQCVKAVITPKNACITPSPGWDQSSVAVEAQLTDEDQTASFTIANEGQGDMSDSTAYRVFANEALVEEGRVKLSKGEKATLQVPLAAATLRLEADQSANHPGSSRPTASVQPPVVVPSMAAPTPVDAFYQDDADAEVSISCLNIIDSFDPNDKQVTPQGITRRHYIKAQDELQYQIRFQNTGTDTAYTVVVKDTLSAFVDVSSLRIGSASHPFTYSVSGKGRPVLTFSFKNINLPDHKTNEPASHGYIRFSVGQAPGNPKGTVIKNVAYNYFDYNSPIVTNEVFNIIGDTLIAPVVPVVVYDCGRVVPTTARAGADVHLCETSETVLQANAPVQGLGRWRILSGQATLSEPTNPQATLSGIGYGEVVLEWSISLCERVSRSQVKVYRYAIPAAPTIAAPPLQCEGKELMALTATGSNITWYGDADKQQKLHAGSSFTPQISATTTFYATQTVNGCEGPAAAVAVQVHPASVSFAISGDTLVAPVADSYQWYFNGQQIKGATAQQYLARNTGAYTLQAITMGCVAMSEPVDHAIHLAQARLKLHPNPAHSQLQVELAANETGEVSLIIWDRLGRKVDSFGGQKQWTVLELALDLDKLSPGLYLLEVRLGKETLTRKFVKQ